MRRFAFVVLICALCAGGLAARAQVVASATRGQISLTAGGLGSVFQTDYAGYGVPETSPYRTYGVGAYVDFKLTRWIQLEAEGRWIRFNPYIGITQDNYLLGPRLPIHHFRILRATPYGKALVGLGNMTFEYNDAHGRFTDVALGGGVDMQLTKRISIRAIDFEYQLWPNWVNGTLKPYGASVGVGYKIF